MDFSPISESLREAASRAEYQCHACKRWWRREDPPPLKLLFEFKNPLYLMSGASWVSWKIFRSLTALNETPPVEVWAPLLLGPLAVVLSVAFIVRGLRKRLTGRKLLSIEKGTLSPEPSIR